MVSITDHLVLAKEDESSLEEEDNVSPNPTLVDIPKPCVRRLFL